ncbi:HPr family phosphocarrier protein [Mycoplasmoides gallisepticum]|uniref:HPr family phosphocarrier protein n=1 Tax=Mycoplasmoides gallisepticum TaxID=2096 RepID=UPI001246E317|nr:HPr family phosphocarrier protein [Mycoplasmoides gallisepticum]QEX46986.1 HPr family phosphocarrier protein [Mycoplasmoides gallisepticum]ULH62290.1 HPr family phosphocarrier protein [Mycoplasmoides gallisepticum]ULH67629.1 HPr family phosphocarrier protein [Mycoplasmoides gallisepticum]ULH68357.1 HPr family phosphocarrier protein [Mycoplasmoides gallisepticum]WGG23998.1 HPr family phosphocarrier protein [Mycoplasmoides gallisepticum]
MKSFKATIIDPFGLHVRTATVLSSKMGGFKSKVTLKIVGGATADVKSIINLMSLAIKQNTAVEFIIEGEDEEKACEELQKALKDNKLI